MRQVCIPAESSLIECQIIIQKTHMKSIVETRYAADLDNLYRWLTHLYPIILQICYERSLDNAEIWLTEDQIIEVNPPVSHHPAEDCGCVVTEQILTHSAPHLLMAGLH